jgi:hypothetical protein
MMVKILKSWCRRVSEAEDPAGGRNLISQEPLCIGQHRIHGLPFRDMQDQVDMVRHDHETENAEPL